MRNLTKLPSPTELAEQAEEWLRKYRSDKENQTNKYRYRHPDIKDQLKEETGFKCVYCESKIGHNTPGDIEHKIPSSKRDDLHFDWANLTIACGECNRRKNDYYEKDDAFLDPYVDDVESMVIHHGPIVSWSPGAEKAEVAVRKLELHDASRTQLVLRKIEKIEEVRRLLDLISTTGDLVLAALRRKGLAAATAMDAEYSAMVISIVREAGVAI